MRVLKVILLTIALVFGLSLAASAQKGQQKPPPKENPAPRVDPGKKNNPPPKGGDKPKKPGMALEMGMRVKDYRA